MTSVPFKWRIYCSPNHNCVVASSSQRTCRSLEYRLIIVELDESLNDIVTVPTDFLLLTWILAHTVVDHKLESRSLICCRVHPYQWYLNEILSRQREIIFDSDKISDKERKFKANWCILRIFLNRYKWLPVVFIRLWLGKLVREAEGSQQ